MDAAINSKVYVVSLEIIKIVVLCTTNTPCVRLSVLTEVNMPSAF